jgi:hypothetical protein
MTEVVRLSIGKGKPIDQQERYKIVARAMDLRDVCETTGKSVFDLLNDPFAGWPYLLQFFLRQDYPRLTKNDVANIVDKWLKDGNEYDQLGKMLMQALENGRFVSFPKGSAEEEVEGEAAAQS